MPQNLLVNSPQTIIPTPLTTAERDAITAPALGRIIRNTSTGDLEVYLDSSWQVIAAGTSAGMQADGSNATAAALQGLATAAADGALVITAALPATDPHVAGQWYVEAGTVTISAG